MISIMTCTGQGMLIVSSHQVSVWLNVLCLLYCTKMIGEVDIMLQDKGVKLAQLEPQPLDEL